MKRDLFLGVGGQHCESLGIELLDGFEAGFAWEVSVGESVAVGRGLRMSTTRLPWSFKPPLPGS